MSEEEQKALVARVENLELALVSLCTLIQHYMPADCEESLYNMGKDFYDAGVTLDSRMLAESNSAFRRRAAIEGDSDD